MTEHEMKVLEEFRRMFRDVTEACLDVLVEHLDKGDSWKTCPITFLRAKVREEYREWIDASSEHGNERHELIDLINMCVMLRFRIDLDTVAGLTKILENEEKKKREQYMSGSELEGLEEVLSDEVKRSLD